MGAGRLSPCEPFPRTAGSRTRCFGLLGSENAVSGVSEAGADVSVFIQLAVEVADVNLDVRGRGSEAF